MTPTRIIEGNLFYVKSTDCSYLPHLQYFHGEITSVWPNNHSLAKLTHKINHHMFSYRLLDYTISKGLSSTDLLLFAGSTFKI